MILRQYFFIWHYFDSPTQILSIPPNLFNSELTDQWNSHGFKELWNPLLFRFPSTFSLKISSHWSFCFKIISQQHLQVSDFWLLLYTSYFGSTMSPTEVNCCTVDSDLHKFNSLMSFPAVLNYSCKSISPSAGKIKPCFYNKDSKQQRNIVFFQQLYI